MVRRLGAVVGRKGGGRRALGWGFVDQSFSSATNFGLTLIAGRILGPAGLGRVFLGFSVYLVVLSLQRRLLTEPLIAATSSADKEEARTAARLALTMSLMASTAAAIGTAMIGSVVPGFAGRGLVLIAPWLVPALLQDVWRNVLFRDGRGGGAAANDGAWFVVMALMVPLAWTREVDWAVVAAWGAGATGGAIIGFVQTGLMPGPIGRAWRWWRRDALPFGKWNAGAAMVGSLGGNASAFIISAILGAQALGGLRAAQSIFAPLTLIIPAISLPGLPAVARARARGFVPARRLALRLSALALASAGAFVLVLVAGGWRLLPLLFGDEFLQFRELIWPISTAQMFTAAGVGLLLLMKAERRGRTLLLNRAIGTSIALTFVTVFALMYGLVGAAWGTGVGAFASLVVLAWSALRLQGSGDEQGPAVHP
jgi:O-antigen/teichoic acid export membrane protein